MANIIIYNALQPVIAEQEYAVQQAKEALEAAETELSELKSVAAKFSPNSADKLASLFIDAKLHQRRLQNAEAHKLELYEELTNHGVAQYVDYRKV